MTQRNVSGSRTIHDLTGSQRDLLYVIAGLDESHGLAIKEELEDHYEKEIHHGGLYPNLDKLVKRGLVEKGEKDRRTNVYTLTRRGHREIEAAENGSSNTSILRNLHPHNHGTQ